MPQFVTYVDRANTERFHAGERFETGKGRILPTDWCNGRLRGAYDWPHAWTVGPIPVLIDAEKDDPPKTPTTPIVPKVVAKKPLASKAKTKKK